MGEHIDNRKHGPKRKKAFTESTDPLARRNRVTFKNYLREVEENLLEEELEEIDEDDVNQQI